MKDPTPGPWEWENYDGMKSVLSGSNDILVLYHNAAWGIDPQDAAIIQHAGEMYKALKALQKSYNNSFGHGYNIFADFINNILSHIEDSYDALSGAEEPHSGPCCHTFTREEVLAKEREGSMEKQAPLADSMINPADALKEHARAMRGGPNGRI